MGGDLIGDEEEKPNFSSSSASFVLNEDEEGDSGSCAETLQGIRRPRFLAGEEGRRYGVCRKLRTPAMGGGEMEGERKELWNFIARNERF